MEEPQRDSIDANKGDRDVHSAYEPTTVKRRTSTGRSFAATNKTRSRHDIQSAGCLAILTLSLAISGCSKSGDDLASLEKLGAKVTTNAEGQVTSIAIFAPTDAARLHFSQLAGQLDHLEELTLQGHAINDLWLRELLQTTKLRRLHLHKTRVTDVGLPHINALTTLEVVDLSFCDLVTDDGIAELDRLINLQTLNLDYCRGITDGSLAHLHSMDSLASLSIADTNVTDEGLRMLVGTTIQTLHAGGTQVTDDGLVHLRNLIQLRHLHLDNTAITDAGLSELGALIYLRGLDLDGNHITDQGLENLREMNSLRRLNLVSTDVTPEGIGQLKQRLDNDVVVQHGGVPFEAVESDDKPTGLDRVAIQHESVTFDAVKSNLEPTQNPTVVTSIQPATLALTGDLVPEDMP